MYGNHLTNGADILHVSISAQSTAILDISQNCLKPHTALCHMSHLFPLAHRARKQRAPYHALRTQHVTQAARRKHQQFEWQRHPEIECSCAQAFAVRVRSLRKRDWSTDNGSSAQARIAGAKMLEEHCATERLADRKEYAVGA